MLGRTQGSKGLRAGRSKRGDSGARAISVWAAMCKHSPRELRLCKEIKPLILPRVPVLTEHEFETIARSCQGKLNKPLPIRLVGKALRPLQLAIYGNRMKEARILMELGADVNLRLSSMYHTVFFEALALHTGPLISTLIPYAKLDEIHVVTPSMKWETRLEWKRINVMDALIFNIGTATRSNLERTIKNVQILIYNGVNPTSGLVSAISIGCCPVILELLKYQADLNAVVGTSEFCDAMRIVGNEKDIQVKNVVLAAIERSKMYNPVVNSLTDASTRIRVSNTPIGDRLGELSQPQALVRRKRIEMEAE